MDDNRIGWQGDQLWWHSRSLVCGYSHLLFGYVSYLFPAMLAFRAWNMFRHRKQESLFIGRCFFSIHRFCIDSRACYRFSRPLLRGRVGADAGGKIGDLVSLISAEKLQPSRQHFDPGISFSLWGDGVYGAFLVKTHGLVRAGCLRFWDFVFRSISVSLGKGQKIRILLLKYPHYDPQFRLGNTNLHLLLR